MNGKFHSVVAKNHVTIVSLQDFRVAKIGHIFGFQKWLLALKILSF